MGAGAPTNQAGGGASISDILTTLKNLVIALNNATQAYLSVNGLTIATNISAPTLIKGQIGRLVNVSVTHVGSTTGEVYDSSQVGSMGRPLYIIPEAVGLYQVNLPASFGLLVVPGTGQVVAVSYS
jgi:hypothetical protein